MHAVAHLVHAYGLLVVAGFIGLEALGIPLPGETALIVGAVIAGHSHELSIVEVIPVAALASIAGRAIGYAIALASVIGCCCATARTCGSPNPASSSASICSSVTAARS